MCRVGLLFNCSATAGLHVQQICFRNGGATISESIMNQNTIIRLERESDHREVECLTREAFWNVYRPGCTEHYVLHLYRGNPDFIPELDFVMETDGIIMGHVMFSRAWIIADDGRSIPILTFGPISIAPAYKRRGYGLRLLNFAIERARELGYGAIFMEGNIAFYAHAGFVVASSLHIHYYAEPREREVPYFLGLELKKGFLDGVEGTYHTPKGYFVAEEDPEGFARFDESFPCKEKLVMPGQLF